MKRAFVTVGGVLNLLFGLFHIWLGRQIYLSPGLTVGAKGLMQAFNIAGALFIFYFAFVSLFQREELLGTRLGKTTMGLVVLIYFSRAAEEFVLFRFQPLIFVACLIVGLLYLIPLLVRDRAASSEKARAASA